MSTTRYSDNSALTVYTGLSCNGSEDHLFNCAINTSASACSSTENDANVICPG